MKSKTNKGKFIKSLVCLLIGHNWYHREWGALRSIYCIRCGKEIFPTYSTKTEGLSPMAE